MSCGPRSARSADASSPVATRLDPSGSISFKPSAADRGEVSRREQTLTCWPDRPIGRPADHRWPLHPQCTRASSENLDQAIGFSYFRYAIVAASSEVLLDRRGRHQMPDTITNNDQPAPTDTVRGLLPPRANGPALVTDAGEMLEHPELRARGRSTGDAVAWSRTRPEQPDRNRVEQRAGDGVGASCGDDGGLRRPAEPEVPRR